MPLLGGYDVSIRVDGKRLKEYTPGAGREFEHVEQDDVARCYIASESGKKFGIRATAAQPLNDFPDIFASVLIDERKLTFEGEAGVAPMVGRCWSWYGPTYSEEIGDYPSGSKFAFGDVIADRSVDGKKRRLQGTIIVTIWQGNYRNWKYKGVIDTTKVPIVVGPENAGRQSRTTNDLLRVNAREKLTRDHCIFFSTSANSSDDDFSEEGMEMDRPHFNPNSNGQAYTFIFHYNSFRQLQSSGIIANSEEIQHRNNKLEEENERLKAELEKLKGGRRRRTRS
ncbi:hypothetical protein CALVIDRAFT_562602 [Calocera viscosa TUFC12733]|uniref:DUF7918 domain-containing protein n=1 Tax=Calocera viscosa (strain TUFC12733) TaxID=1330018 RepID=A0A167NGX9_CALVF|nr:hypothetical protein CALVIDRAFT_562602 [Calocera viscosa TUFC12733]